MQPTIRALTIHDADACVRISTDRDWNVSLERWREMLGRDEAYGVEVDGELVATVTCCDYQTMTFLGMMLVHSSVARRGIGSLLMRHVMQFRPSTALVATEMGQRLYETLNFTVIDTLQIMNGTLQTHCESVRLVEPSQLSDDEREGLVARDARAFGSERRGLIVRGLQHASAVAIADDGSFAFARDVETRVIGPVVADDSATSATLIRALATSDRPQRLFVRTGDGSLIRALEEAGLQSTDTSPIMVHGLWRPTNRWRVLYSKGTS